MTIGKALVSGYESLFRAGLHLSTHPPPPSWSTSYKGNLTIVSRLIMSVSVNAGSTDFIAKLEDITNIAVGAYSISNGAWAEVRCST